MNGLCAALLQHLAIGHHHQLVGQQPRLLQVVRHQQHGHRNVFAQVGQQGVERLARHLVHRRKRFVQQQHRGLTHQRARHRHPLLLPTRQGAGTAQHLLVAQAHALQHLPPLLQPVGVAQGQGHVVQRIQVRHQRVVLKHHAHTTVLRRHKHAGARIAPHRLAQGNAPVLWAHQPGHRAQQRAFARTRRPHQRHQLPRCATQAAVQPHGRLLRQGDGERATHAASPGVRCSRRLVSSDTATATIDTATSVAAMVWALRRSKACTRS